MLKSLKRLQNVIEKDRLMPNELYKYIRFHEPEAVADMEKARAFLLKDIHAVTKIHQMMAAVKVKAYLVKNRDHTGGEKKTPYDVYKEISPNGTIKKKHFNEVFQIVDAIELTQEQLVLKDASKAIAQWLELGEDRESILKILHLLASSGGFGASELYRISKAVASDEGKKKEFQNILARLIKGGPTYIVDALCALNLGEKADTALENSAVYYAVSSRLREGETILIVEPSCAFIRKWLSDEHIRQYNVTFSVSDENVCNILAAHYKRMKNVRFISSKDIGKIIKTEKTANHVIVFGTRYYEVANLVHDLKVSANKLHRIALFAPDKRVSKGELQGEGCDDKIQDIEVTLFPAGILGETSPQYKTLFCFSIDALSTGKNTGTITVKSYSLEKGFPQKLRKNILTVEMPLESYIHGTSFRNVFRVKEEGVLKKTDQTRDKAEEFYFTEEITICYTLAMCADDRLNICAYVKDSAELLHGAILENISDLTRKNTRKSAKDLDVQHWLSETYPYETIRTKKKTVDIRAEVGKILREAYRGKSVTLSTLVYMYPKIEQRLNKREKEQLRKVCESELGDVQVNALFPEYLESVLDTLYAGSENDTDRYVASRIISMALEVAVRQEHARKNCLGDALEQERREKKRLSAVLKNLVKKNFTLCEMRKIYDFLLKKIRNGAYEYVGVLIRFLTGLENNVVCALKWRDLRKVDDGGCFKEELWQLDVCRKLQRDGRKFFSFDKVIENRKIPCADILVQALLCERARQLAIVGSEEALANRQIVQAKEDMVRTAGVSVFPPDKLNQCGREAITAAGIDEHLIRLPGGDDGIIEVDLNKYHGDIFKRNYEHWAKNDLRWKEGEIAYVLGRTPKDVFSDRYEHFEPSMSQHILLKKQESIAAVLLDEAPLAVRDQVNWDDTISESANETTYRTPISKTRRTQTTIDLSTEAQHKETHMIVECEYGYDIIITEVE